MNAVDRRLHQSGWRILIAGTGGQGVLTAARLLCGFFVDRGRHVVSGQLHGMAQRGGAVQSCVIIDGGISPVIASGRADFVLGFEPVETVRALPLMSPRTLVYMNTTPVIPFVLAQRSMSSDAQGKYPDVQQLVESIQVVTSAVHSFDATRCAVEAGSMQTLNMVMLGCLLGSGSLPCSADEFWESIAKRVPQPLSKTNAKAFARGAELAAQLQVAGGTP